MTYLERKKWRRETRKQKKEGEGSPKVKNKRLNVVMEGRVHEAQSAEKAYGMTGKGRETLGTKDSKENKLWKKTRKSWFGICNKV